MLPPGHIAAGYLTAYGLIKFLKPDLDPSQLNHLLFLGAFFGFAPDLDTFFAFFKSQGLVIKAEKANHRFYVSHGPILWLIGGLLIYFLAQSEFYHTTGLLLWLASWSHFALDSIEYGIMWLWPMNKNLYALKSRNVNENISEQGFFNYWLAFLKYYSTRLSFYLEIFIILLALIIYLK